MYSKIRHCVEESNIDENLFVTDPSKVVHVTLKAGRIESMSAMVDPKSHLNLDFSDHKITKCVIAEKLELGSHVRIVDEGLVFARVDPASYKHYGPVDYTLRLGEMIDAVKKLREVKAQEKTISIAEDPMTSVIYKVDDS
jgi:hypothetical protein